MESVDILLCGWYKLKYTFWVPCLCSNCRVLGAPQTATSPLVRARSSSLGSSSDPAPLSPTTAALIDNMGPIRPTKPLPALPKRSPALNPSPNTSPGISPKPAPVSPSASSSPTTPTGGSGRALPQVPPSRTERQQMFKKAASVFELQQGSQEDPANVYASHKANLRPTTVVLNTGNRSKEAPANLPSQSKPLRPPTMVVTPPSKEAPAKLPSQQSLKRPPTVVIPTARAQEAPASLQSTKTRPQTAMLSPTPGGRALPTPTRTTSFAPFPSPSSGKQVARAVTASSLMHVPVTVARPITPPTPTEASKQGRQPLVQASNQAQSQQKSVPPPPRPPPPPPVPRAKPKKLPPKPPTARRTSDTPNPNTTPTRPRTRSLGEGDAPGDISPADSKPRAPSPTLSLSSSFAKKRNLVSRFLSTSITDIQALAFRQDSDVCALLVLLCEFFLTFFAG